MRVKTTFLLLSALLFAACGRAGEPGAGRSPDEPVASTPSNGPRIPQEPQEVTPRPGMADVRPIPWIRAQPKGEQVTLVYWSGVEPCNVLDHVDVEETADSVTITLYEGHDPDAEDVMCIELAVQKQTTVTLEDPVGGRELVDGAS